MTNRPKQIGTAGETAVARAARAHGFPHADRLTLTGHLDRGDVGLCPGIILEVKSGKTAELASHTLVESWLADTEVERHHAGAEHAFLVTKRSGVGAANAHRWWAWGRLAWLDRLRSIATPEEVLLGPPAGHVVLAPVRLQLIDLLHLLREHGWGTPPGTDHSRQVDRAADECPGPALTTTTPPEGDTP